LAEKRGRIRLEREKFKDGAWGWAKRKGAFWNLLAKLVQSIQVEVLDRSRDGNLCDSVMADTGGRENYTTRREKDTARKEGGESLLCSGGGKKVG